jgi:hypothetical protein
VVCLCLITHHLSSISWALLTLPLYVHPIR